MLSAYILINVFYIGFVAGLTTYLLRSDEKYEPNGIGKPEMFSLIIPLRNEVENAQKLSFYLKEILDQFDQIEIILVFDNSSDDTQVIFKEWCEAQEEQNKIKLISISDGKPSKKKAIDQALKQSKYNWVIQSDADCELTVNWLKSMTEFRESKLSFIAGPVAFKTIGFWTSLITIESWALILISYLGFRKNEPQMCSAANMAWDKSALNEKKYSDIINIKDPSGDDAYLLNYFNSRKLGMKYNWNKHALIRTSAPQSLMEFINQRIRWASKWGAVKGNSQFLFPLFLWLYHLLFYLISIVLLFSGYYAIVLGIMVIKAGLEYYMLNTVAINFGSKVNLYSVLLLQILYSPYVVIFGLLSQFAKYRWK